MDTHAFIRMYTPKSGQGPGAPEAPSASCSAIGAGAETVESPRTVIRGESLPTPHTTPPTQVAITDYLNITFPFTGAIERIATLREHIFDFTDGAFGQLKSRHRGLHGYTESFEFENGGVKFAYGGQGDTGYLSIPGEGCALLQNKWDSVVHVCQNVLKARITRWDGAVDDFEGRFSVDVALDWYLNGKFGTGGNKPKMIQVGNWAEPDGSGRTLNIGARKNGKLLRVYEKGKQLGDKLSPWTRWEIELHNTDRCIPFEVLLNPRPYIAGAYSCMEWISEETCRIRTTQKTWDITYEHLAESLRIAYGPLLHVMMSVEGSAAAVMNKVARVGMPKRLIQPVIGIKGPLDEYRLNTRNQ